MNSTATSPRFRVVKRWPSVLGQMGIAKTEPGDENNQDISSLVGKVDIRKLEKYSQDDPDAYSYSGGLCLANQGCSSSSRCSRRRSRCCTRC
jgi:serine protein kinase